MANIRAQKGKLKKYFTEEQWKLLGDKNGWVQIEVESTQIVINAKKAIVMPPASGEKKKIETPAQVVDNTAKTETAQVVDNQEAEILATEEFKQVILDNTISKTQIKDKLDEIKVPYKNSLSHNKLIDVLATHFKNNIEELKTLFKIETPAQGDNDESNTADL